MEYPRKQQWKQFLRNLTTAPRDTDSADFGAYA
jgi:hypothetical protein